LEPVSPELVLVDPELAQAERARLASRDNVAGLVGDRAVGAAARPAPVFARAQAIAPTPPLEQVAEIRVYEEPAPPAAAGGGRRRFRNALLTVSLMANAVLISVVVAGSRENQSFPAFPATLRKGSETSTRTTTAAKPRPPSPTMRVKRQPQSAPKTVGAVERMILTAVAESPKGKLPPSLINPATGLAKNNLQSVCHASIGASFSCVIRPARHRPTEGLHVRYRQASNGRWTLKWYPYHRG
jgi:hypothetical protein